MSLAGLKYVNALGGIQAEREDGVAIYLKPGTRAHDLATAGEWGEVEEYVAPVETPLTAEQLDAIAERVADELLENDAKMKALGLVIADLVEQAFNVSPEVARAQVKGRFRTYYRGLIE